MPTLKELKEMVASAEKEVEQTLESMFEGETEESKTESTETASPENPAAVEDVPAPPAEPVFVSERAYGHVDGIPGVKYQQDGEYFDSQRKFVRKA